MASLIFLLIVAAFVAAAAAMYQSESRSPIAWAIFLVALALLLRYMPALP